MGEILELERPCTKCDGTMIHCTAGQFKFVWWECLKCGYVSPHSHQKIPKDVIEFHHETFPDRGWYKWHQGQS